MLQRPRLLAPVLTAGVLALLSGSSGTLQPPTPTALEAPAVVGQYQETITAADLAAHVYLLASDLYEGREASTRGQKLAAHYLATRYRTLGLEPKGTRATDDPLDPSAYFQPFDVYRERADAIRFDAAWQGNTIASTTFSAKAPAPQAYPRSANIIDASGPVVFAGYGIADETLGYDDYAALADQGVGVTGKWVMVLGNEPLADATTSLLPTPDGAPSRWNQSLGAKRTAAMQQGTVHGLLIVDDLGPGARGRSFAEAAAARAALYGDALGPMLLQPEPLPATMPRYIMISSAFANQILAPTGTTVEALKARIDDTLEPAVFEAEGVTLNVDAWRESRPLETENVLAYIEGSDPVLKEEVVVITSHYDHNGINTALPDDPILNGAADDASGTAATLELAEAFMAARADGRGPRRSILFLNTSAEEKGLFGSQHYTDVEPVIPLERTAANINMDGIGGTDPAHADAPNYIYVMHSGLISDELRDVNEQVQAATGIELKLEYGQNFSSDHLNFANHLVPYLFYSTGFTEHYHTPDDEPETLDYGHMERVARLAFATAWELANRDARPARLGQAQLSGIGYVCPPCIQPHDDEVHDHPGYCPTCGMRLAPVRKQ